MRTRKKIRLGKFVELESVPTAAILQEIEARKLRVFRAHVGELKATALAEVPVAAKPHHGHLPGHLRASITAGVSRKGNLYVSAGGRAAPHGHLVEYGTKDKDGSVHTPADPFMGRTLKKVNRSVGIDLKRELGRPL